METPARPWWRHLPNAISLARIAAAPFLLAAVLTHNRRYFPWLLLACLLSDILDGWIARTFNLRSPLGAFLDSTADILVQLITIGALWIFQKETLVAHSVILWILVSMYLAVLAIAVLRYGRISSFHTILSRVAAYAQGFCILSLFFWGYAGWIFYTAVSLCILACAEELLLLYSTQRPRTTHFDDGKGNGGVRTQQQWQTMVRIRKLLDAAAEPRGS